MLEPKDFPQMWQKPSSQDLRSCLQSLEMSPTIWSHTSRQSQIEEDQEATAYVRREMSMYLSSIVKSGLTWIDDEEEKEFIWSEASRRLSERCGRTAMGEITRRWPFRGSEQPNEFELIIREPPLTGDSLGHKTWGSSYVLARHLPQLTSTSLARLFAESQKESRLTVLELGSGTGLLGIAAAALWKVDIVMSDLPEIMANLHHNADANRSVVESLGGSLKDGALTWGSTSKGEVDQALFGEKNQFKIVLAADPMYDDIHPVLLAGAFSEHLSFDSDSRAVVMVPLRDETTRNLLKTFRASMEAGPDVLQCIEEGTLDGQDDWGEGDDSSLISCWWGVFARTQANT
ncbi:hypothetical protein VDGD_00997 [Verticillium dahliae]|nr:hypothetical protein VdG1_03219 [Verticillium dahliae VDG1]RBQ94104.1 hypothetical protein VDGD_00997 [Verticillium dahliae]